MVHLRKWGIEEALWAPQPTQWESQGLGSPPTGHKMPGPPASLAWLDGGAVTQTRPEAELTPHQLWEHGYPSAPCGLLFPPLGTWDTILSLGDCGE